MFGVMIELYARDPDSPPRLALHSQPFDTEQEAQDYIGEARRQNLPFKGKWIISFEDPRVAQG